MHKGVCSEIRVLLMNADFCPQNDRLEQGMLELKKAMNTLHQKSVEVDASVKHQFNRHQARCQGHFSPLITKTQKHQIPGRPSVTPRLGVY